MIGPHAPAADDAPRRRRPVRAMTGLGLTLLVALTAALVLGAVAHRLRLPPMLGYILAGLAVGPATPGFVADSEEVLALADVGVALLMFSIGLQHSLDDLRDVGSKVLVGTPVQVAITMAIGTAVGLALGWDLFESLFVGGAVSVASTVVLVKVAGESALQTTAHGRTALAVSIVQDLLTVVLVVALSSLGGGRPGESAWAPAVSVAVAVAFIAVVIVGGSRILPPLLAFVAGLRSRELFVITVAVIAIGTAFAAGAVGVSVALGAFVAGLALADSDLTASVLGEIVPLRELFSTFFFVSIGILLQPPAIMAAWPVVLVLLLLITLGKAVPVAAIARLDGLRGSSAIRAGALIGQSGEFSFVLASAGLAVGVVAQETFSLVMGAVVLSMLAAGPLDRVARMLGDAVDARLRHDPLAGGPPLTGLRRHAVILGYGRVGRAVARVLDSRGFVWVAVEGDYAVARAARATGAPIVYGDAGTPSVLDQARVEEAHALVVAIPDALATRQAVMYARSRNERIEIVARAHSEAEETDLRRLGVARVVLAEREVGNELIRHALRRFGVSDREVAAILGPRRGA
jgi:monovalent cation:H+ antiporter-2, CPA2 family